MRTNVDRVVAAVALYGTIPLVSPKVTDYSIRPQPVAQLQCDIVMGRESGPVQNKATEFPRQYPCQSSYRDFFAYYFPVQN